MENIYLVMHNYDYEGSSVISVHRTVEGAIEAGQKSADSNRLRKVEGESEYHLACWSGSCEDITVEKFELED